MSFLFGQGWLSTTLWRVVMSYYLCQFYLAWWKPRKAWKWSGEECWMEFREAGYTPYEAMMEDLSYAW